MMLPFANHFTEESVSAHAGEIPKGVLEPEP